MDISDVMIHINENLVLEQRHDLENDMRNIEGVIASRFNIDKEHLLLIAFDPKAVKMDQLLNKVTSKGYQAQLVGA